MINVVGLLTGNLAAKLSSGIVKPKKVKKCTAWLKTAVVIVKTLPL